MPSSTDNKYKMTSAAAKRIATELFRDNSNGHLTYRDVVKALRAEHFYAPHREVTDLIQQLIQDGFIPAVNSIAMACARECRDCIDRMEAFREGMAQMGYVHENELLHTAFKEGR